jgi:hypothetical protein
MGDVWRWNVNRLKSFWPIFNGKKLISIATGDSLATPDIVRECFDSKDVQFMVTPNSPFLCETSSFIQGLELLKQEETEGVTFYGHAKGVTHEGENLKAVQRWTDAMYVLNLSSAGLIDKLMQRYQAAGCYRQKMRHAGSDWHYSGTFFWFNNATLFSRNWRDIEQSRHGTEGYPGRHFNLEETFEMTPFVSHWQLYRYPPEDYTYRKWLEDLIEKEIGVKHG